MPPEPPFDISLAHRWFSADCFHRVWGFLDKEPEALSESDRETMLSLAHASLAHWRDREDATRQNFSVGYWLLSRVYSVLGDAGPALRYGHRSLEFAEGESPFFLGYGHEAIARAAKLDGDEQSFREHLQRARSLVAEISDPQDRSLLESDLTDLSP